MERTEQPATDPPSPFVMLSPRGDPVREPELIRVCLVCGAELEDRACKLVCRCGYFLSCSDYL